MESFVLHLYGLESETEKKLWPTKGNDVDGHLSITRSFGYIFGHKIDKEKIIFKNPNYQVIGNEIVRELKEKNDKMNVYDISEILNSFGKAYSDLSKLAHPPKFVRNDAIYYDNIIFDDAIQMVGLKTLVGFADKLLKKD